MNRGRFGVTWLMALIGVAALEFWAIRLLSSLALRFFINGSPTLSHIIFAYIVGAIPFANILALGLLIYLRNPCKRPFLLGFETIGAITLTLYIAGLLLFQDWFETNFFAAYQKQIVPYFTNGQEINSLGLFSLYAAMFAILTLPQLAIALFGGLLFKGDKPTAAKL